MKKARQPKSKKPTRTMRWRDFDLKTKTERGDALMFAEFEDSFDILEVIGARLDITNRGKPCVILTVRKKK